MIEILKWIWEAGIAIYLIYWLTHRLQHDLDEIKELLRNAKR